MKKDLFLFIIFAISLLVYGQPTYAIDLSGYLDNKIQVTDDQDITETNKLKLDAQVKSDTNTYFLFFSLVGINTFPEGTDAENNNEFKLNRAYLDLYPSWGKITVGLQNIAWGNGYVYNLADLFNSINILDPKGEKDGINAIDTKWHINETARVEVVVLPGATVSDIDYGLRGQFTLGGFELTANALCKTIPSVPTVTEEILRYAYVLECKGQLGETAPGVWVQGGYFRDEPAGGTINDYYNYVLGSDYTFAIGNGLYLLGEYLKSGSSEHDKLYLTTRYTFKGYLTWSLAGLRDIQNQADMYSLNLKYLINDNIEFSGTYNYYPLGSQQVGMPFNNSKEIILGIKTNF